MKDHRSHKIANMKRFVRRNGQYFEIVQEIAEEVQVVIYYMEHSVWKSKIEWFAKEMCDSSYPFDDWDGSFTKGE